MRLFPIYAAALLCFTGCASTQDGSSAGPAHSTFTEQSDTRAPGDQVAPPLPIRAIPVARLPIQAVPAPGAVITTAKLPIVPMALPIIPVAAKTSWTLTTGHTIGQDLQVWGGTAGWKVIWSLPKDWSVPANSTFHGDFKTAASDVIKTLAANGALVRAQFYDGNKTMVVSGPGTNQQ